MQNTKNPALASKLECPHLSAHIDKQWSGFEGLIIPSTEIFRQVTLQRYLLVFT